jgi:hypothetical protein
VKPVIASAAWFANVQYPGTSTMKSAALALSAIVFVTWSCSSSCATLRAAARWARCRRQLSTLTQAPAAR